MATQSDFIRLDAEHAARLEISKVLQKYSRRIYVDAKAHIAEALASADASTVLDGTAIGEAAVERAVASYLGAAEVQPAIEADSSSAERT